MTTYDLYGIREQELERARAAVEMSLSLLMVQHESGYRGGIYYRAGDVGREHYILQPNYIAHDDEWVEEAHSEYPFLLYANEVQRPEAVAAALEGLAQLLRRQEL